MTHKPQSTPTEYLFRWQIKDNGVRYRPYITSWAIWEQSTIKVLTKQGLDLPEYNCVQCIELYS